MTAKPVVPDFVPPVLAAIEELEHALSWVDVALQDADEALPAYRAASRLAGTIAIYAAEARRVLTWCLADPVDSGEWSEREIDEAKLVVMHLHESISTLWVAIGRRKPDGMYPGRSGA